MRINIKWWHKLIFSIVIPGVLVLCFFNGINQYYREWKENIFTDDIAIKKSMEMNKRNFEKIISRWEKEGISDFKGTRELTNDYQLFLTTAGEPVRYINTMDTVSFTGIR